MPRSEKTVRTLVWAVGTLMAVLSIVVAVTLVQDQIIIGALVQDNYELNRRLDKLEAMHDIGAREHP